MLLDRAEETGQGRRTRPRATPGYHGRAGRGAGRFARRPEPRPPRVHRRRRRVLGRARPTGAHRPWTPSTQTSPDRPRRRSPPAASGMWVGVSALGRGTPVAAEAGLVTASLAMDDLIVASGVAYRALANPSFMDNVLRQVASLLREDGVYRDTAQPDRAAPARGPPATSRGHRCRASLRPLVDRHGRGRRPRPSGPVGRRHGRHHGRRPRATRGLRAAVL